MGNLRRRDVLRNAAAGAMAVCGGGLSAASRPMTPPRKPNVVLIVADDLGYGDLACFGNKIIRTPNVDRLARRGVSLMQHYSASPLCAPARAALLTGRYNHRTGAVDVPSNRGLDRIALGETTLADVMKRAGYATGMVGKWHNGVHDMRYHPNARGFDEFTGFLNGGMDYYQWVLDVNGKPRPSDGRHLTDVFTDESVKFIRRHKDEPFFLYVAYNAPHVPLQAPTELVERYRKTGKVNTGLATLYAMIEQMDAGVGRIVTTLEKLGLAANTVVIFTSDNGPAMTGKGEDSTKRFNGPLRGRKGDSLEGGIRVPAIVSWPGELPADVRSEDVVHFIDWLPTLAGLTGRSLPDSLKLDGRDVMFVLRGKRLAEAGARLWFWQRNRYAPVAHCNAAVREGKWKLYWADVPEAMKKLAADNEPYRHGLTHAHEIKPIDATLPDRTLSTAQAPRLYDLDADPGETTDLAASHPDRVAAMKRKWDAWFRDVMEDYRGARASNIKPGPTP